ncbi:MAG: hypothetical protein R3B06_04825 [Kofleriaceae bacterium]
MSIQRGIMLSLVVAAACGGGGGGPAGPDGAVEVDGAVAVDAAPAIDAPAAACDVSMLPPYAPVPIMSRSILPSDTAAPGETINDVLQGTLKRHYLVAPAAGQPAPTRALLWLAGSGAEPHQFTKVLAIGAAAGYLGVSLAYDNETQVAQLCGSTTEPACNSRMNLDCGDQVRQEIIYGTDTSPCIDVPRADSIEHRVVRLVQYVDAQLPMLGARGFLDATGAALDWSKWAVGGWSQGGGHAGVLARDHLVARALFVSKGGDSVLCPLTTSDPDRDCDVNGDGVFDPTDDDELQVPAPATYLPRLTPGSRAFGAVHEREGAWAFSRETFAAYGMGAKGSEVRVDGLGPFPAAFDDFHCAHTFSTIATPASGPNDFHISMAIDGAMAVDADGVPVLAPMYFYALTVPVP